VLALAGSDEMQKYKSATTQYDRSRRIPREERDALTAQRYTRSDDGGFAIDEKNRPLVAVRHRPQQDPGLLEIQLY
jgi:hypothetical protein